MDVSKALLVVGITILIVIGINVAIYASANRKNSLGQFEMLRKVASRAKDPWEMEDTNLSELSRLVKELQDSGQESRAKEDQENV